MTGKTSKEDTIEIEYHACRVCGDEPDPDSFPPEYVLSLDPDDRDDEEIMAYPFGGSLSVPFACSDACFLEWTEEQVEA